MARKNNDSHKKHSDYKEEIMEMNNMDDDDDDDNDDMSEMKDMYAQENKTIEKNCPKQRHTHEFLGSTKLAELQEDPHNHRFAGVTGEAIRYGRSHYHLLETNTDFFDHFHEIENKTSLAIPVGNGKHVHFVMGKTSENDNHRHNYAFATLIESPLV
jgi:hypothetical protein